MNTPKSLNSPRVTSTPQPRSIRRHCKIARLAPELRERLNLMLRDGASYRSIMRAFRQQGCHLNQSNLSRWNAGGFQDWLREQAWLEEMRLRLDFASTIVKENNSDLLDRASLRIAVVRLYSLLMRFDPATLSPKLADSPGAYVRVLKALCQLTRSSLDLRRNSKPAVSLLAPMKPKPTNSP